ncbi:nuclear transport factor 2 family protein [Chitinophaga agrisoli]|uniref:Nuclear transport factor 2 family protein n=1 Tax=Chitinophaga agrisoli TaxID=2607653 RepID=A0A5B2VL20_9BACT|nr:nuclear transport factor 2 family protein [Chitinophaga agrisoli]KAA2239320.1 nuclear transport factor 2 family protein [Chitinophaga agrisoli]
MKRLLLFLVICSMMEVSYAQSKDEKAVTQAVENLRKAMVDADKAMLEKLTDARLSYGHSGGNLEDQATFVKQIVSGHSDFVTMDLTEQTVTIVGNTAIVRHKLAADTNDSGKPGTVHLRVMLVWAKEGGEWKLLGRQAVKEPVKN